MSIGYTYYGWEWANNGNDDLYQVTWTISMAPSKIMAQIMLVSFLLYGSGYPEGAINELTKVNSSGNTVIVRFGDPDTFSEAIPATFADGVVAVTFTIGVYEARALYTYRIDVWDSRPEVLI